MTGSPRWSPDGTDGTDGMDQAINNNNQLQCLAEFLLPRDIFHDFMPGGSF